MKRFLRSNRPNMGPALTSAVVRHCRTFVRPVGMVNGLKYNLVNVQARSFSSIPSFTAMKMPSLSPTMSSGNLGRWVMEEGAKMNPGDIIAEVETDKATVDFECQDDGYLAKILIPGGTSDIPVGRVVAIIVDSKEDADKFKEISVEDILKQIGESAPPAAPVATKPAPATDSTPAPKPAAAPAPAPAASVATPAPSPKTSGGRIVASPYARRLASERNVPLSALAGTGPSGRIIAADVLEYKPAASAPGSSSASISSTSGSSYASLLATSKFTVPHYYLTVELPLDNILALKKTLNELKSTSTPLELNDFVVRAAALASKRVPEVNSSWLLEGVRTYEYIDIANTIPTKNGTVAPVIRDVQAKGLLAIASESRAFVKAAEEGSIADDDTIGATFTITNLSKFGVKAFQAIIAPPQAAVLAVGAAERRVVPGPAGDFSQATFMSVTLSCDHRVVDGAVGAKWLEEFKSFFVDPNTMLL